MEEKNEIQKVTPETISTISYKNKPVLTTELLAFFYGVDSDNINRNHERNSKRFEEGKHFFRLTGKELKTFKHEATISRLVKIPPNINSLTLWTERGAVKHAKMLGTEKAWEVYEKLEDCYFNKQSDIQAIEEKLLKKVSGEMIPLITEAITDKLARVISHRMNNLVSSELTSIEVRKADETVQSMSYDRISHQEKTWILKAVKTRSRSHDLYDPKKHRQLRDAIFYKFGVDAYVRIQKRDFKEVMLFINNYDFSRQPISVFEFDEK